MALFETIPLAGLIENGIRTDGRKIDDLRPTSFKVGLLPKADGSASIDMGKNRIVTAMYGPREVHPRHLAKQNTGILRVFYRMATFAVDDRKSPAPSRREVELSMILRQALEPALFLQYYPKTMIDLFVQVLSADGGTRCACLNAASLALADAGIAMRDLVTAVAVGKISRPDDPTIVLDLSDVEDKEGTGDLPIAMMPRNNKITLLQFDGTITKDEFNQAYNLGVKGIQELYQMQKDALREKYAIIQDKFAPKEENSELEVKNNE